jgi:hypothetical protein
MDIRLYAMNWIKEPSLTTHYNDGLKFGPSVYQQYGNEWERNTPAEKQASDFEDFETPTRQGKSISSE